MKQAERSVSGKRRAAGAHDDLQGESPAADQVTGKATTAEDHRFCLGNVDVVIPAGTPIESCRDNVGLFAELAHRALIDATMDLEGDNVVVSHHDLHHLWGAVHLLQLTMEFDSAAQGAKRLTGVRS